jgi:hypothetical protein
MSKGGSGHFSGTNGANKTFSDYPKTLHAGRQDKHIPGTNNYTEGRSIFSGTKNQAEQLIKQYSGTGQMLSNNRERVDFGRVIGYYVDPVTQEKTPTTMGTIHYSKDGAHIVPARPKG